MKPIVCNEKATLYIPDIDEQCEYWLIPVHSVEDISNPDRNHAWILPNGDFYVYDGTSLVLVNDLSDLTVNWGNITGSLSAQTDLMEELAKYVKGITLNGVDIPMDENNIVNLTVTPAEPVGTGFDFAIGTILETSNNTSPATYYGGTWSLIQESTVYSVIGTKTWQHIGAHETSVAVHSWTEVQQMFYEKYGFYPASHWLMYANYSNGDADTNSAHVEGATFMPTQNLYYALFTDDTTQEGALRVQYHYAYEHSCYKWVKTGA